MCRPRKRSIFRYESTCLRLHKFKCCSLHVLYVRCSYVKKSYGTTIALLDDVEYCDELLIFVHFAPSQHKNKEYSDDATTILIKRFNPESKTEEKTLDHYFSLLSPMCPAHIVGAVS